MKHLSYSLLVFFLFGILGLQAQNQLQIADIEIVNLGDGQRYVHKRDVDKIPLDGKIRIITGVTTEYIDTELKKGYVDGKWEYYANNKLKESTTFKNGYV